MRRRILPRILAAGVLVLALAGCVRFQADLTLTPENTVDGSIVVAVLVSEDTDEAREQALGAASQIEADLLGSLRDASGVTTKEYEQDDYLGSRIILDDVALDAFSGQSEDSLKIVRDGDDYVFTGAIDFSGEAETDGESDDGDNLTVTVAFPGEVTEHNGDLEGTTVSWSTAIDQRLEMSARGAATPAGPPILLIVGIALVALLVVGAIVAVLLVVRSRGRKKKAAADLASAAPEAPIAASPAAGAATSAPEAASPAPAAAPEEVPPASDS